MLTIEIPPGGRVFANDMIIYGNPDTHARITIKANAYIVVMRENHAQRIADTMQLGPLTDRTYLSNWRKIVEEYIKRAPHRYPLDILAHINL